MLVKAEPDTNALNVTAANASFYFDETINDRGSGAQEVDAYFLLSPSDGAPHVSWHRKRIDIRPRHGFRPNTAYVITMLPGLSDLSSNKMKTGTTLVFSTGPTIPKERITGTAFDWGSERPAPSALIEAVTPDSIIYLAQADSLGHFVVGPLPAGSYLLRATIDQNGNRNADRSEATDTVRITVPQAAPAELLTAVRDTLPARILTVAITDSVTLNVTFDRALEPAQPIASSFFRLKSADSADVPLLRAMSPAQVKIQDSIATKTKADSARRADSLAGKPAPPATPPAQVAPGGKAPPPPPPKPSRAPPFTAVVLKLTRPLAPNTPYRLSVSGIKGLSGREQPSDRTFTTPKAPTPAKPDSAKPPATPAPRPAAPPRR